MKKDTIFTRLYYGVIKENPIIVLALGLCPALAVSATAKNGLAMGVFTSVVLIVSNFFISLFKRLLPKGEKILLYVFLIASFTIVAQLFLKAYFPEVNEALGVFAQLTAVNGVIYYRAENYAVNKNPGLALFDGIGVSIGYTFIITLFGALREIIGLGTVFDIRIIPEGYNLSIASLAPGAFFILACLVALGNKISKGGRR